jgi:tetratricopeptide (TPR) repeat protein
LGARNNNFIAEASESSINGDDMGFGSGMPSRGVGSMSGRGSDTGMGAYNRYANCELRARLTGFRSQSVMLGMRRPLDNPNIGTILLHRQSEGEGNTISVISAAAPKGARKMFEKGRDAEKKNKLDDAAKNYAAAAEIYPKYATAWYQLGRIQAVKGQTDAARKSFETAVEADPKYVEPRVNLAALAVRAQQWKEAAELSERAMKLDPFDYPQAFFYNAVANYGLSNLDAAEKSAREAARLDTRHQIPQATHLLGVILAQRHDYTGAAEQLRNYLKFAPGASNAGTVRSQLDQIEKMTAQAGTNGPQQ